MTLYGVMTIVAFALFTFWLTAVVVLAAVAPVAVKLLSPV